MAFCKVNDCSRQVTHKAEVESGFCVEHLHIHIGDLKTQADLAASSRETNLDKLATARDAIAYALRRVGTDAEFAYHMLFTETLDRLVRAFAKAENRDPSDVRRELLDRTRLLPKSRCAADREFIDGGCQL